MALDNVPKDNYPFATKDGKVIPLDIIRPVSVIIKSFNAITNSAITIPEGSEVAVIYATSACLIQTVIPAVIPSDGVVIIGALHIPANTLVTAVLKEGTINVIGLERNGSLVIQAIEKWAGLSLDINYTKR